MSEGFHIVLHHKNTWDYITSDVPIILHKSRCRSSTSLSKSPLEQLGVEENSDSQVV